MNKQPNLDLIKKAIENRSKEILSRNPHEHEFESGSESLENDLLNTIDYVIFSDDLLPLEKSTVAETIIALKSVTKLLESEGEVCDQRDSTTAVNLSEQMTQFGIINTITYAENPYDTEIDDTETDDTETDDDCLLFDSIAVKTIKQNNHIIIECLQTDCYTAIYGNIFTYNIKDSTGNLILNTFNENDIIAYIINN